MVRVPNWVGDAVMAVPALRELRRIFVGAQITLVARPWVAGLFEGEGLADDWIAVNDTRGWLQSARQFIQTAQRLRSERFDFAVLLQNAFGAALAARLGGARQIAGYPTDGRRALLHHAIAFEADYKSLHQVRYYLNIAAHLERLLTGESHVQIDTAQPALRVSDRQRQHARQLIEAVVGGRMAQDALRAARSVVGGEAVSNQWSAISLDGERTANPDQQAAADNQQIGRAHV